MRRCEYSEKEQSLHRKIRNEHALFKYQMLSNPVRTVYDSCNKIRFYESMMEYFQYKKQLNRDFVSATKGSKNVIQEMYEVYLHYENLKIDTWSDIEELLKVYQNEKCYGVQ